MTDDPRFYAWIDGELDEPEASEMADRVAADPELARLAEQHRALNARLKGAFAPLLSAPLPDQVRSAIGGRADGPSGAEVIDFAAAKARRFRPFSIQGLAVAASLALGLAIGLSVPRDGGDFRQDGGRLLAAASLDRALDRQLASAGEQDGVRIGLSFRDGEGRYCRSFTQGSANGLACRSGDGWAVEGLVAAQPGAGDYRMASGGDPAIGALIDQRLAGEPLDESAERVARDGGWQ